VLEKTQSATAEDASGESRLDGNHVFALPSCIASFHLPSPRMGSTRVALSCCRWRNATSRKLVPFSHHSASRIFIRQPGCIPSPVVTQDGDHQFDGGEKRAGLRPQSRPQLQGSSSSLLGRRVRRVGACLRAGSGPLLPSVIGGKGVRRSWRWQLPRARLSGLRDSSATSGATSHRGSQKRFLCRRDSRRRPQTDLRLYGLLLVLAPRVGTRARALSQQCPSWDHRCCCRGRWRVAWSSSSRRLSDVEVVHTRGSGTGVPFVMAP
jgi:hypothetical protein